MPMLAIASASAAPPVLVAPALVDTDIPMPPPGSGAPAVTPSELNAIAQGALAAHDEGVAAVDEENLFH